MQLFFIKKHFITLVLLLNFSANAQTNLGLWAGIGIEKKITPKFAINVNTQTRFVDNFSYLQTHLAETSLEYKINEHFDILGAYRFTNRRKNESSSFKNRHRFYGDVSFNKKFSKIKFDYRLRYQHQFKDNDGEISFDKSYLRNKIELSYLNKSKLSPYLSGDLFYEIGNQFDQIRPKIGVSYKINKHNSLDASIFTNIDLAGVIPANPIIGIGYKLKF